MPPVAVAGSGEDARERVVVPEVVRAFCPSRSGDVVSGSRGDSVGDVGAAVAARAA
ncbi:hypothetical protein N5079_04790 [Planotetraspora sp. A-T 1434]|uniref:hypothetical protein n=1 Tax=Planotetraspora sp. A-T 1434 TaxID=2979219 RepID=UPI0021C0AD0B|nr:hypothetical protein [Planotetraspora sp. A-T 1434]MCT9929534.1 hypothetical protein [Planotetraspora sp. A-T 1434]